MSALERQKAEFEENVQAEVDAAYTEGAREVTAEYRAQVHRIRQRAWELRWRAALKKARISKDDPDFKNPPKFQSSDPGSSSDPGLSSEPAIEADASQANPKTRPEADAVQMEIDYNVEAAAF